MIRDILVIVGLIFLIGVSVGIVNYGFGLITDAMVNDDQISATATASMEERADNFSTVWDYTFLTIFVAVVVGALILSYVLRASPALFFLVLIVVVLVGILAGFLSNAFGEIAAEADLSASYTQFPIMSFILNNYLLFIVVVAFLMMFVFFAKPVEQGVGF